MIEDAVKVLNELLKADPGATNEFFRLGVTVNTIVCDHPTIQVSGDRTKLDPNDKLETYGILRPLGLINGFFLEGNKVIVMIMKGLGTEIDKFTIGIVEDGKVRVI